MGIEKEASSRWVAWKRPTSPSLWVLLLTIVSLLTFKLPIETIHIKCLEYDLDLVATEQMVAPPTFLSSCLLDQIKGNLYSVCY